MVNGWDLAEITHWMASIQLWFPLAAFAQTEQYLNRQETNRQEQNQSWGQNAAKLKPGQGGKVYSNPERFPYDYSG